jgi:hypothetical protein
MSYFGSPEAIISMAQHEIPIGIGQTELFLAHAAIASTVVVINPSPFNNDSSPNQNHLS